MSFISSQLTEMWKFSYVTQKIRCFYSPRDRNPLNTLRRKYPPEGNSLTVQWLGLHPFTAEGLGSIPHQGTKIPHGVIKKLKKISTTKNSLLGVESEPADPRNLSSDSYLCHVVTHTDQECKQKRRISLQKSADRQMKILNLFTYSFRGAGKHHALWRVGS